MLTRTENSDERRQARPAGLTPEEGDAFHERGYVVARGVAGAELCRQMLEISRDHLEREVPPLEYEADLHYPGAPPSRDAQGGRTVRRLKQAHSRHPVFTDWLVRRELTECVRQLLGPEIVVPLAHHNCVMTKHPRFSSNTGWHQDIRYWSFSRPELITVWLALGRERADNGGLRVIPRTHRMDFARHRLDEALFLRPERPENRDLIERQVSVDLDPGDVLFFHCRTFHSAGCNRTGDPKFSVVFTFRPGDNPPVPGTRSASRPEMLIPPRPSQNR